MCERTFCPNPQCGQELIHRDHRHGYESASALGQIIHRMKRTFTFGDIDGITYKRTMRLLRFVEHKQTDQPAKYSQTETHQLLDGIVAHYVTCPTAVPRLHPESGVYLMRGHIDAATTGRRATMLAGPQTITNERLGELVITDESDLYEWLEGRLSPRWPS